VSETYTGRAADAITQAARAEHDFAGWLAAVLATAAARLSSSDALIAGRPGSWEASLVDQLVKGTVGHDDEYLPAAVFRVPLDVIGEDDDAGKLAEIRGILAAFDWERDDRQYALERIEMIAGADR
jgi:hypothetical protein